MSTMQNVQTQQQQSNTQQQQKYVNKHVFRIVKTLSNGVIDATIEVYFTADLIKELFERKIDFYHYKEEIKWFNSDNKYVKGEDVERIIRRTAIKKALETNEQKSYYKVILDVDDVIPQLDQLIAERIDEENKRKEEEKRIEEEKKNIIEQIKQKVKEFKEQEIVKEETDRYVELINYTRIYYSEKLTLEELKKEIEKANSINAYKILKSVIESLKSDVEYYKKQAELLEKNVEMLKNIIKKLVSEEELREKLEEYESKEEEELTKEEVEYLLSNVFDC